MRHLRRFEGVSCSRIGIIEPQLGKVWLYVLLSSNYLVGRYSEVFPRQTGMLEQMTDMVEAILHADPDEITDHALIGLPMGSNE